MSGYWYLATVYSKHPQGVHVAWLQACRWAAQFIKAGVPIMSPIAHSHPIAMHGVLDHLDHSIWLPADAPLMAAAKGLIVVTSEGWLDSVGITAEIAEFERNGKPIVYWSPGTPIGGLFDTAS